MTPQTLRHLLNRRCPDCGQCILRSDSDPTVPQQWCPACGYAIDDDVLFALIITHRDPTAR